MESLDERISNLLSQWNALQMAVNNEWGGSDSFKKSQQLTSDILSWLFHSKGTGTVMQVEDLENLLHERMLLTFNTEIEDGSIEEVAEKLLIIRDENLMENPSLQEKLKQRGQQTLVQDQLCPHHAI